MSEARRVKSRAGCVKCKRRKVKCDQGVPSCQQCIRQKISCPGYQKPLKWIPTSSEIQSTNPPEPKARSFLTRRASQSSELSLTGSSSSCQKSLIHTPSIPAQIASDSTTLIHHYFTQICKIAGCYDSPLSPFRTIPAKMMTYSPPVYLLLQASSAAQLSLSRPTVRYQALTLQAQAFSAVRSELSNLSRTMLVSDELMLTCIIAGLTSSWYDVNDLGISHVLGSQFLLSLWLANKPPYLNYQETFILGAYTYWLAISAFVTGDPRSSFEFQGALQVATRGRELCFDVQEDRNAVRGAGDGRRIFPHPLTGFSMQTVICVGKVGSLCRLASEQQPNSEKTGSQKQLLQEKAHCVEKELIESYQAREANFQDPQDPNTNIEEILAVGEAYRCAGLLQLYTIFPSLLLSYQPSSSSAKSRSGSEVEGEGEGEWEDKFLYELRKAEEIGFSPSEHEFLRNLAFHILSILETIPPSSSTRVLQGLPALIAATWFIDPLPLPLTSPLIHPHLPISPTAVKGRMKLEAREVVRKGLRLHERFVGLRQVARVLDILEEVWRRDDEGVDGRGTEMGRGKCDWIKLVAEMGMATLYG